MVEHSTLNRRVQGSSPWQSTKKRPSWSFLLPRGLGKDFNLCHHVLYMANPGPNKLYLNPQTNLSPYRSRSEPKPNEARVARPFASNLSACPLITFPWQSTKKKTVLVFFIAWGSAKIDKSLPLLRKANPGQVQVTNFQFEPFGICLPLGMRQHNTKNLTMT